MNSAMKDINTLIDTNTVIGKSFTTNDGSTVIPVSKVTLGFIGGGGEYGDVKALKGEQSPFAGGSGAVVSLKPTGFLVDDGKNLRFVCVPFDAATRALETAEEFIKAFKKDDE